MKRTEPQLKTLARKVITQGNRAKWDACPSCRSALPESLFAFPQKVQHKKLCALVKLHDALREIIGAV